MEVQPSPLLFSHLAPHHHPGQTVGHALVSLLPGRRRVGLEFIMVVGDYAGEGVPVDHEAVCCPPILRWGRKEQMEEEKTKSGFLPHPRGAGLQVAF